MKSKNNLIRVRNLLLLVFCMLGGMDMSLAGSPAPKPYNVLFILTDNQPASVMGTYGNPDVKTPNVDQLAAEGMRFTRAYAVNGVCSPTRATLMTGLMPSQHGVHNWLDDSMLDDWPKTWSAVEEFRTLPLTLKNRGYKTGLIGKWHLGQPWKPSIGYEHWVTFTDGHTVDFWNNTVIDNDQVYKVNDRHIVDFFTDKAVEFIRDHDGKQPFYLQLNYDGPYLNPPTNMGPARNRFYKEYVGKEFKSFPRVAFNANMTAQLVEEDIKPSPFLVNIIREAIAMHNDPASMANVASQNTLVDDGVGKVMAALKEAGLDENTLVIYSTDQGNFYGQHGMWLHAPLTTPASMYDTAMNIPLIMRHPGSIEGGQVSEAMIGQYDIPQTILDYLDINDATFDNSPGKSFVPVIKGEKTSWQDAVYFEQEETRGIRTDRYSYWKRLKGTGEAVLYDMEKDPGQHTNVAGDTAYAEVVAELDKKLTVFFNRYSDKTYDLWRGGVAKGSVMRPEMFRGLYGEDWAPRTELLAPFKE